MVPADGGPLEPGQFDLDTNARHRLAVARFKIGDINEGMHHANVVDCSLHKVDCMLKRTKERRTVIPFTEIA